MGIQTTVIPCQANRSRRRSHHERREQREHDVRAHQATIRRTLGDQRDDRHRGEGFAIVAGDLHIAGQHQQRRALGAVAPVRAEIALEDLANPPLDRLGGTTYSFTNLDAFLNNQPSTIQYLGDESAPSVFNNGATGPRHTVQNYYIGYAQDEWRMRRDLTITGGVRFDVPR